MNTKQMLRDDTAAAVEQFLAQGGEVKVALDRETCGLSSKDWARVTKGLKVASAEEIKVERERRALIAITNKDVELTSDLLLGKYDKEIKHDIESDRLGPNGEIR